MVGVGNPNDSTRQCGRQAHGLSALVTSSVLPSPVVHSHLHEVKQDPIGKDHRIMGMELFDNTDGVSPKTIVVVAFIEDVVDPAFFAEPLLSWEDCYTQYPGINLMYHQLST